VAIGKKPVNLDPPITEKSAQQNKDWSDMLVEIEREMYQLTFGPPSDPAVTGYRPYVRRKIAINKIRDAVSQLQADK